MRTTSFVLAVMSLLASLGLSRAADVREIDRKIVKEPEYQTKLPRYCLLVFGQNPKKGFWLVQDGDVLYVDRNGNGDLTEKDKRVSPKDKTNDEVRVFDAGAIRDGTLTHTELSVMRFLATPDSVQNSAEFERIKKQNPKPWMWWVRITAERSADMRNLPKKIKYVANGDGLGYLLFGDKPENAPVIHFNGPWTLGLQDLKQRMIPGHESMLQIGVGTPGVGPGTFSFILYPDTIASNLYPVADITFPARSSTEKPLVARCVLKKRC